MSADDTLIIPDKLRIQLADGHVEEMPLDEYLKGVVPTEMGLAKPLEALKAQAIAARSYAVTTRRHATDGFDLCSTAHCQVYKPKNRYADSDQAVDETSGWIVTYKGRIVATHFFAHCDGRTRSSEEVWSSPVAYYRSVPCICGYDKLYGHGVGMCQRGAAAMAEQGATVEQILAHYYTGVEIAQATIVPRYGMTESVIFGQVVDAQGQPHGGERLVLEGPTGRLNKGTMPDGRFWFTSLPARRWTLTVKGQPVRYADLFTDGRSGVELNVVVPSGLIPAPTVRSTAGPRQLAGRLGYDGVPLTVVDPAGNELTVLSGSAPEQGPGGFALPLAAPGAYRLQMLGQQFDVEVQDLSVAVEFGATSA
jgi:hypothetical protein